MFSLGAHGLGCRRLYSLTYASTREDAEDRLWRRKNKLEAMLIYDGERCFKPKGMHWRTFEGICDQLDDIEGGLDRLSFDRLERIAC